MQEERCYVLQIFEMEPGNSGMIEIPFPYRSSLLSSEEEAEEREKIRRSLSLEGKPLVTLGTFVCRNFEKAQEIMLDSSFLPADWINCYGEKDQKGRTLEIYLSTDRHYLCRIYRTEIY